MPFINVPSLGNTKGHPRLGVPTFRGITISPVPPSAVEFFAATGTLRGTLDASEATSAIVCEIATMAAEVEAARSRAERPVADAARMIAEAGRLADLPILGSERRTIEGFAAMIATGLEAIGLDGAVTASMVWLKSIQGQIHGLDATAIGAAVTRFDREMDLHTAAVEKLRQAHTKLLDLAGQCDDGPNREKVSRIKASMDYRRRLPGVLAGLQAGREQVAAALEQFDTAISSLKEAA